MKIASLWNEKIAVFLNSRNIDYRELLSTRDYDKKLLWIHAASLGEYEQGRPIIEKFKEKHPECQLLISVFSPSAYTVIKGKVDADFLMYLPFDTKSNAHNFLNHLRPDVAVFIKYEIWPNFLKELQNRQIPSYLVSAIFRPKQIYFKAYGTFFKKTLKRFNYILTQDKQSDDLLHSINFNNTAIAGDTRFDRVNDIISNVRSLPYIKDFKANEKCVIFGSSWPEDEAIYLPFINESKNVKFIIAPHKIEESKILALESAIDKKVIRFSTINEANNLSEYEVFILDTIGLLTAVYAYADIAYIGGGFKTGLHNTLEAAAYGIPVIIGPKYDKFKEAKDLVSIRGIHSINSIESFKQTVSILLDNKEHYQKSAAVCKKYTSENLGATQKAIELIEKHF